MKQIQKILLNNKHFKKHVLEGRGAKSWQEAILRASEGQCLTKEYTYSG